MRGLLLVNLGTPDEPTTGAVRRYLAEFLADPRVLDLNPIGRALLLHLVILRTRPKKSAHAYQQIWGERGSPLLYHSEDLTAAVAAELGADWRVVLAMRYGRPSIASGLAALREAGARELVILPLYPQAAASSSGSTVARVFELAGAEWEPPALRVVPPFHADAGFLAAFADQGRAVLAAAAPDHVLFSFHGLPERHIRKSDPGAHCLAAAGCCDALGPANAGCYRAQCFATARALAAALALPAAGWSVSFQSRLGRTPWIQPHTDKLLDELPARGCKRLAVFCPAFVADCLETVEEIGLRARAQFRAAGGEELVLVPSLNATPRWVEAVAALARRHASAP